MHIGFTRKRLAAVLGGGAVLAAAWTVGPAHATTSTVSKSTLSIASLARSGANYVVTGKEVFGGDAAVPMQVAVGSGTCPLCAAPNGLALGKAFITDNVKAQQLTLTVDVTNQPPAPAPPILPGYVIDWQFAVDGLDSGYFLQTGHTGDPGLTNPSKGNYFVLCQNASAGFNCSGKSPSATLSGKLGGGVASWSLPFSDAGIKNGSQVASGHSLGTAPTIASTLDTDVLLFYNNGGDSENASAAVLPGSVALGVAPAGTPVTKVKFGAPLHVATTGGFTGTVAAPKTSGSYELVAKSCWGSTTQTCITTTKTFTQ